MKIAPGTPLNVSLQWDSDDIQPVGRLAYRDQIAYLEFDQTFLKTGLELSPVHHKTNAGLQRPYDIDVFAGLHGICRKDVTRRHWRICCWNRNLRPSTKFCKVGKNRNGGALSENCTRNAT